MAHKLPEADYRKVYRKLEDARDAAFGKWCATANYDKPGGDWYEKRQLDKAEMELKQLVEKRQRFLHPPPPRAPPLKRERPIVEEEEVAPPPPPSPPQPKRIRRYLPGPKGFEEPGLAGIVPIRDARAEADEFLE